MTEPTSDFADIPLGEMLDSVASHDPTPGAGPSLAWTCALAAALVEMVSAVTLRQQDHPSPAAQARRDQARRLRAVALSLADVDAAAYRSVLAVQRRRGEPGHAVRLRQALADAADPLVRLAEVARAVAGLAAEAAGDARGGVRGEAITALTLANAVATAVVPLVELNLASDPDDPRRALVRDHATAAASALQQTADP